MRIGIIGSETTAVRTLVSAEHQVAITATAGGAGALLSAAQISGEYIL